MIQLTDINGRTHAIHPDAIARLVEPGISGKWHGVNCYVKTFDGDTIEVRESVSEIMQTLAATEREACAALCDRFALRDMHPAECAAAIRARGGA